MTEISLAPEPALELGHFAISNTMTATVLTTLLIIVLAIFVRRGAGIVPSRAQVLFESFFTFFLDQITMAVGSEKKARQLVPIIMTFFTFIFISNLFILLPFVSVLVTGEGFPFLRTPTTDYSMTIALAFMIIAGSHVMALFISPLGHVSNFIRLKGFLKIRKPMDFLMAIIDFFLGILEVVSEVAKVFSLATRLFGNIVAGEVVIAIVVGLMFATKFIVPIPFIVIASFAGVVQAFVFTLLSLLFMSMNIRHASHSH
ncbi:MAG: FoF1 ATP synthase subunit a [Candidatus Gracilibacteria bacterium]